MRSLSVRETPEVYRCTFQSYSRFLPRGLDVMTRELMQEYYLKLFEDTGMSTVFITAELEEAIFLADRIYVMSDAPGRIVEIIDIDLPRPRKISCTATKRYAELEQEVLAALYAGQSEDVSE